jgi:hypothetical protein
MHFRISSCLNTTCKGSATHKETPCMVCTNYEVRCKKQGVVRQQVRSALMCKGQVVCCSHLLICCCDVVAELHPTAAVNKCARSHALSIAW